MNKHKLLFNKYLLLSLAFALIQQIVVASSTYWIAGLANTVYNRSNYVFYLVMFFLSLTVVYIPTIFTELFTNKAIYSSYRAYIDRFAESYYGKPTIRLNKDRDAHIRPHLESESWIVLNESVPFFVDWFSCLANVVLNVFVIGWVINPIFILAYVSIIPITVFLLKFSSQKVQDYSKNAQRCRSGLFRFLTTAWDTILTGNTYNFLMWSKEYRRKNEETRTAFQKSLVLNCGVSSASMVLSLAPIILTMTYYVYHNSSNVGAILVLVATIPRQIQLIQYISDIVNYQVKWHSVKVKIEGILGPLGLNNATEKNPSHIQWNKIFISDNTKSHAINCIEDISKITNNFSFGRFTIRGENGIGKSSLLSLIKETNLDASYLLSTQSNIYFHDTIVSMSSGEKMISHLKELSDNIKENIVLLDEWDSNLDAKNTAIIENEINRLAESHCVIEVRHKG